MKTENAVLPNCYSYLDFVIIFKDFQDCSFFFIENSDLGLKLRLKIHIIIILYYITYYIINTHYTNNINCNLHRYVIQGQCRVINNIGGRSTTGRPLRADSQLSTCFRLDPDCLASWKAWARMSNLGANTIRRLKQQRLQDELYSYVFSFRKKCTPFLSVQVCTWRPDGRLDFRTKRKSLENACSMSTNAFSKSRQCIRLCVSENETLVDKYF